MKDRIKVLEMIASDMKSDAEYYEGQAFNGKNVAEYFGKQGAAIAALANIMKSALEQKEDFEIEMNTSELRTASRAIFIAVHKDIATDISNKLKWAADKIDILNKEKTPNGNN